MTAADLRLTDYFPELALPAPRPIPARGWVQTPQGPRAFAPHPLDDTAFFSDRPVASKPPLALVAPGRTA